MACLFCQIAHGEIPADIVYNDDQIVAFNDLNPQAPVHQLLIPKQHITTLNDITPENNALLGHMVNVAKDLAHKAGIAEDGYRVLFNCNAGGGQSVFHIHMHLCGGRQMRWPPG